MSSANILREEILTDIKERFKNRLEADIAAFEAKNSGAALTAEVVSDVRAKFEQTFASHLQVAFDVMFKEDFGGFPTTHEANEAPNAEADTSVSGEQLQEMDDALVRLCRKRQMYPAKCSLLLEKSLSLRKAALTKLRVDHDLQVIDVLSLPKENTSAKSYSAQEAQEETADIQGEIVEQTQRVGRVENAFTLLADLSSQEQY